MKTGAIRGYYALASPLQMRPAKRTTKPTTRSQLEDTHMNRIITALALSGLFVAAPAFAKTHSSKPVASAGDKAVAGDKAAGETKTETKTEGSTDATAKPAKKVKKSKKVEKTEEKPAEAPAK